MKQEPPVGDKARRWGVFFFRERGPWTNKYFLCKGTYQLFICPPPLTSDISEKDPSEDGKVEDYLTEYNCETHGIETRQINGKMMEANEHNIS